MILIELRVPVPDNPEKAIVEVCQALTHTLEKHLPPDGEKRVFGPQFRASGHHERFAVFRLTDGTPIFSVWEDIDKLPDLTVVWEPKC